MMRQRREKREGFSLLEVILAMAIFLIAIVGIGQLMSLATDQALEIDHLNRATQLLQSKLAEVVAGVVPLSGQGDTPYDDDPAWSWSVDAQSESTPNLYRVTVTVTLKDQNDQSVNSWTMNQLVLDPAARGVIEAAPAASSSTPSSSTPTTPMGGP